MPRPIYMDHHATTPVLPEVLAAMTPYFTEEFGNPSSTSHVFGRAAADAVEHARRRVADLIGASPAEIVFTSGATEANNLAVRGAALARRDRGRHVITCAVEHESILEPCRALAREGFEVTVLPVDRHGLVDPGDLLRSITGQTILVTIQTANSEIGTIQPIAEVARIAREKGVLVHTDAVQAAGRVPLDAGAIGADLLSVSAHKIYGPKGVGALFVRRGTRVAPLLHGGGQEKRRRAGTLNVPGIVGFGAACAAALRDLPAEPERERALRDRLRAGLIARIDAIAVNGHPERRLPNNLNVTFRCVEGEALLVALRDVAALSTGSACATGAIEGSYVLRALGLDDEAAHSSLRFGLGRGNTEGDVDAVIDHLARAVARLRALSPKWEAEVGAGGGRGEAAAR